MLNLFDLGLGFGIAMFLMIPVFLAGVVAFFYFLDNYLSTYRHYINNSNAKGRPLRCRIAYFSEKGARKRQEDSYYVSPMKNVDENGVIAVVSDGIGGLKFGNEISRFVTDKISEDILMILMTQRIIQLSLGEFPEIFIITINLKAAQHWPWFISRMI